MCRMPEFIKSWMKSGRLSLETHLAGGQPDEDVKEAEDGAIIIYEFAASMEDGEEITPSFLKPQSKHIVVEGDFLDAQFLRTGLTTGSTKTCAGAIVHLSRDSPNPALEHNQLVVLFQHIIHFSAQRMAILVSFTSCFCF